MSDAKIYELAGGEIALWVEPNSVMLKTANKYRDPVELGENELVELIEVLSNLLKEIKSSI